jgi:pyruvate kinase
MRFPDHKTRIVATIGPASEDPKTLREMVLAGLNVARLNFSHGSEEDHRRLIHTIRGVSQETGRRVAILGDLPGPKIRIGDLAEEPIELLRDDTVTLTTRDVQGTAELVSVSFPGLPTAVKPGDRIYINDGFILLKVQEVQGDDVVCSVRVGGELRSRKGLNLPGIDLGISAFTEQDHDWLRFAAANGVDALSQSFVATAADMEAVREAAAALGYQPFLIAKIERAEALGRLDAILAASDGIMVARGDLGVEIPIEEIAVTQKRIVARANRAGKPVITATQMLESMVKVRRPTRAEATDVANAILDGTDCVMLSAESAMGAYPVESVAMLAGIAASVEPQRPRRPVAEIIGSPEDGSPRAVDLIAESIYHTVERMRPSAVMVPTRSGATARNVGRFRLPVWLGVRPCNNVLISSIQNQIGRFSARTEPSVRRC